MNEREYWLNGYNGPCQSGFFFRSAIAKEIFDVEERTGRHVVAIRLCKKDSGSADFNIEFIFEMTDEDIKKAEAQDKLDKELTPIQELGIESMAKTIVSGTDPIHTAEELEKKMQEEIDEIWKLEDEGKMQMEECASLVDAIEERYAGQIECLKDEEAEDDKVVKANDIKEILEHDRINKDQKLNLIKEELTKEGAYDDKS